MTNEHEASKSGLQQREKELEAVLNSLRSYSTNPSPLLARSVGEEFRWLLEVWDTALGKNGLVLSIGKSLLARIFTSESTERSKATRTAYLCLSPIQFFIIGLEELINDAYRDTVTRCGMCCERIVHELLREFNAFEMLETNVKFVDQVGYLQNVLSERGYLPSQHLCSSLLIVYDIRNHRGPHDVPTADELEAKFAVSSFPWIYSKYCEILTVLGYDLSGNLDKLVKLCNSVVSVRTTLAIKPGNIAYGPKEALEVLLYKNGFFDQDRPLSEIIAELRRFGYNYPKPSVANALGALTGAFLSRSGRPGVFKYRQKLPPNEYYKLAT